MKKFLFISLIVMTISITPSTFAWDGFVDVDADKRNIELKEIITYQGYLYGDNLIDGEIVSIKVFEKDSKKIILESNTTPEKTTLERFENTAWPFSFQIDTSQKGFTDNMVFVVAAQYDDQSRELEFFIQPNNILDEVDDVSESMEEMIGTPEGTVEDTADLAGELAEDTGELMEDTSETIQETVKDEEEGGGCLIATAAYGTELAPQVQFLREIRDNTVMSTQSGAAFMTGFNSLYYSFSPTIADMERENPVFQEAVRLFITPMISTLSIMTLAENGNEPQVIGLGISILTLNLGLYLAAPATIGFVAHKHFKR